MEAVLLAGATCVAAIVALIIVGVRKNRAPELEVRTEAFVQHVPRPAPVVEPPPEPEVMGAAVYKRVYAEETDFAGAIQKLADRTGGGWLESKVVGLNHSNEDGTSRQTVAKKLDVWDELRLVPEPQCPFDANAIRVENRAEVQVGYLPRELVQKLAASIRRGIRWRCFVKHRRGRGDIVYDFEVALLHAGPAELALPQTFIEWITDRATEERAYWRYVGLIGMHKRNEDGAERSALVRGLRHREEVFFAIAEEAGKPPRVLLLNGRDEVLAALSKNDGFQHIRETREGYRWRGFVDTVEGEDYETPRVRVAVLHIHPSKK